MVFQRSMLNWSWWGQSAMGICALCYICQVWCNSIQGMYALLTGGVGLICHGYICILLYVRLLGCNGVARTYGQFGGCQCAMGICALCYIYMKCIWFNGFPEICA